MEISRVRILVVDDDAVMLSFIENALRRLDIHTIETCHDGASALKRLPILKPDVVLTDIHMERMGGLAMVREMRRHTVTAVRDTNVIFISTDASISTIQEAMLLGIFGYIIKPPSSDTLLTKLNMAIHSNCSHTAATDLKAEFKS